MRPRRGLMVRDGAPDSASALPGERLLTMRENLPLRPFVEHALGLAERALQRIGRHRFDAGVDAGGVLDMRGEEFGMFEETAAIPAFWPRFRQHRHHVHASLARQFDDEMTAAPLGGEQ